MTGRAPRAGANGGAVDAGRALQNHARNAPYGLRAHPEGRYHDARAAPRA